MACHKAIRVGFEDFERLDPIEISSKFSSQSRTERLYTTNSNISITLLILQNIKLNENPTIWSGEEFHSAQNSKKKWNDLNTNWRRIIQMGAELAFQDLFGQSVLPCRQAILTRRCGLTLWVAKSARQTVSLHSFIDRRCMRFFLQHAAW